MPRNKNTWPSDERRKTSEGVLFSGFCARISTLPVCLGCLIVLFSSALSSPAATLSNFFLGEIVLDGDISDFFEASGVPLPGVCVVNDSAPSITGVPGSEGLGEPPLSDATTADSLFHPSGFNQRRIISAYNPDVNGGSIYLGLDLPGGSGSTANPDYSDSLIPVRGSILPFDADANGEPGTIGRKGSGASLTRCSDVRGGDIVDTLNCAATEAVGFADDATDFGVTESYGAVLVFADGTFVAVELREDAVSGPGNARALVEQSSERSFGVLVSTQDGGSATVLRWAMMSNWPSPT
jgi:hypothetical protein